MNVCWEQIGSFDVNLLSRTVRKMHLSNLKKIEAYDKKKKI